MQYKGEADMLTAKELSAIEEQLKAEKLLITKKHMPNYVMTPNSEKSASKWPQNMRSITKHYYHCWIKGDVYEQKIHERARLI